jgi:phosphatidylserine decarboxylase
MTGRMRIDPAGYVFILGAALPGAALLLLGYGLVGVPLLVLAAFFLFFFRDPDRSAVLGPDDVVSPADGRVMVSGAPEAGIAPPGDWQQISIFLSPLDVHVNRIPVSGTVTRVAYQPGKFLPAYKAEAARDNERNEVWIDRGGQLVVCRQVVGVLARRIVCRVAAGARVTAGQRFGVMKFGSRIDVYVPPGTELRVAPGARVRSGESILAVLPPVAGAGTAR